MKKIAFFNWKGGVATTTLAGHTCIYAAERGLQVAGATLGGRHDLRPALIRGGLPWHDVLEDLPIAGDLLVMDVSSQADCLDVLRPDLWVMPMCYRTAYENATRSVPALVGPVLWVWSLGSAWRHEVPAHLRDRVSMSSVIIPVSRAIAECAETGLAAWGTRVGARSPGARAIQQLAADLLGRVGLASMLTQARALPRFAGPMPSLFDGRGLSARTNAARPRLATYFDAPASAA
ncbi:MAG: hypothetical protein H7066_11350 [Cytophagaceae bacterium]|nr:hypothetical protein [Gemmatimonadaceae bacterium]